MRRSWILLERMRGARPSRARVHLAPAGLITACCAVFVAVRAFTAARCHDLLTTEITDFGMMPRHLLDGFIAPLSAYMPLMREGGSLIFGVVCAPVFAVLGPSVFALRMANVVWHAMVLAVFALLAWRLARWRGVLLMAGLWTLAAPSLVKLQQFGWANHLETTLLGGVAVLGLVHALGAPNRSSAALGGYAAGLAAGLAPFFTYVGFSWLAGFVVSVALCRLWRAGWGTVAAAGVGVALGVTPLVLARLQWFDPGLYQTLFGGNSLEMLLGTTAPPGTQTPASVVVRALQLVFVRVPLMWEFRSPHVVLWLSGWVYTAAAAVLCGVGIAHRRRPGPRASDVAVRRSRAHGAVLLAAAAMVLCHLAACLASGFDARTLPDRYIVPIAPFILILVTAGAAARWRRGVRWRNVPVAMAAVSAAVMLCMGTGHLADVALRTSGTHIELRLKGFRYIPGVFERVSVASPATLRETIDERPLDRFELLRAAGKGGVLKCRQSLGSGASLGSCVDEQVAGYPAAAGPWLWEGAGGAAMPPDLPGRAQLLAELPGTPRRVYGLCFGLEPSDLLLLEQAWDDLRPRIPATLLPAACAGAAGRQMHQRYVLGTLTQTGRSWMDGCDVEWLAAGIGMQLARETLPDAGWPPGEPELVWWVRDLVEPGPQRAFECAYLAERDLLAALASPQWAEAEIVDPLDRCLGVPP